MYRWHRRRNIETVERTLSVDSLGDALSAYGVQMGTPLLGAISIMGLLVSGIPAQRSGTGAGCGITSGGGIRPGGGVSTHVNSQMR